jgi:hypothetical protein
LPCASTRIDPYWGELVSWTVEPDEAGGVDGPPAAGGVVVLLLAHAASVRAATRARGIMRSIGFSFRVLSRGTDEGGERFG